MEKAKVLVIEDEATVRDGIVYALRRMKVDVVATSSIGEALALFSSAPKSFASAIIDHRLIQEDGTIEFGIGVVPLLRKYEPTINPIMISGDETHAVLKSWLDARVMRYLYKPIQGDLIKVMVTADLENWQGRNSIVQGRVEEKYLDALKKMKLAGKSKELGSAAYLSLKAANSDQTALIIGESGTGKELIARGIHQNSKNSNLPFMPVNCSAYSSTNEHMESELFGHVKGAFTGASSDKAGIFEVAGEGTVFLDEIQSMSLDSQSKLLRALQEKKIRRLGGTKEYPFRARIIVSAKPDLFDSIGTDKFKADLYYRLNGFDIHLPPLRKRKEDLSELSSFFLNRLNDKHDTSKFLSNEAMELIREHNWPGNIRELEQAIGRAFSVSESNKIRVCDLPSAILNTVSSSSECILPQSVLKQEFETKTIVNILKALKKANGNESLASRYIKVDRKVLRYKIDSLGISKMKQKDRQVFIDKHS